MIIAHFLEDFSAYDSARRNGGSANEENFDLVRLEGFDAGYKAGWDDATKALKDNTDSIFTILRENLSDLTFTYHEARNGILKSLAPVIEEIIQSVLPMILHNSFPAFVLETIQEIASDSSNPTVNLRAHPDHADILSKELNHGLDMPFQVKGDRCLSKDTALLEIGHTGMEIEFTAFLEKISGTVSTFFDPEKESVRYV